MEDARQISKEDETVKPVYVLINIKNTKSFNKAKDTTTFKELKAIIQEFLTKADKPSSSYGKLVKKYTEKVRSIAKKKGIYIIGRNNRKFLGIKFLKSGNYAKKKNKKPNCKEYSYDEIKNEKPKYKINWKKRNYRT